MSNMIGADIAALRSFAQAALARSHEIDAMMDRLEARMDSLPWIGADRERFVAEWHGHRRSMMDLARDLADAAQRAMGSADAQERASSQHGDGGGAGY